MQKFIKSLEKFGDNGWEWETQEGRYRTNNSGEGLWSYIKTTAIIKNADGSTESVYEWKQVLGTTQFSLPK